MHPREHKLLLIQKDQNNSCAPNHVWNKRTLNEKHTHNTYRSCHIAQVTHVWLCRGWGGLIHCRSWRTLGYIAQKYNCVILC